MNEIRAADERIRGAAVRTPLLPSQFGTAQRPLWIKPENLQPVGAFKIRGAFNALAALPDARRAQGVVAYSSGNHAQAIAYAAREFGVPATVVAPQDAPQVKLDAE